MPSTVFGLPTHAMVVHAAVVLIPLAALAVLLHAFWPAARRRLGVGTPVLAGIALILTPLATSSGDNLEHMVGKNALVEKHAELADGLLPWVVGLFVAGVGLWLLDRRRARAAVDGPGEQGTGERRTGEPRWLPVVAGVLAAVAVVGTVQQVVRVGHAGAEATWSDVVQQAPKGGGDQG
ncbi:MAG TPA: DUF2231 domain-containing protein [Blastococcus sp.]|jgi:hypothetical protein|nr:DUF2231 domain-containing protein [Blastococcus sp.]